MTKSRLQRVHKGPKKSAWSMVLTGVEGVGKTTFGLTTPAPIFLSAEAGDEELDNHSYIPTDWLDVLGFVTEDLAGEHEYQTLVVDSVDWIHALVEDYVCAKNKWDDIEAPGYGKGYTATLGEWRKLLAQLERLRTDRGMNVLMIGHTEIKRFNNPDGEDYDRFQMKMYNKASALVREWAKCVFFAEFETHTTGKQKKKGIQTGRRIMHTERRAAFDAKNRFGLPPVLPLSYQAFEEARGAVTSNVDKELEERLGAMDEETRKKFDAWFAKQPNKQIAKAQALNQLRSKEAA